VLVDQALTAAVGQDPESHNTMVLTARAIGGEQDVMAAHWAFADGTTADGTTITVPHKQMDGSVTITDARRQHRDDLAPHQLTRPAIRPVAATPPAGCG
jgi:hypothetical protein